MRSIFKFLCFFSVVLTIFSSCGPAGIKTIEGNDSISGKLIVFHAGSLSVPMKALADSFKIRPPGIILQTESAGSLTSIRKITDLKRDCDILASADAIMIDKMMIPEFATWNLHFAVNEMALVYQEQSNLAEEIDNSNWLEIINRKDVIIGRADPSTDPCGYRTVLTLKLAEKAGFSSVKAENILAKDIKYIRPKEVDLLALLETNTVDYIFLYKSVALQHKLPFIELSDSINLKEPSLNDWYSTVSVEVPGNSPDEKIIRQGEAMVYGITIPVTSTNPKAAETFIKFIIDEGARIIAACQQTPYDPPVLSSISSAPKWLNEKLQ